MHATRGEIHEAVPENVCVTSTIDGVNANVTGDCEHDPCSPWLICHPKELTVNYDNPLPGFPDSCSGIRN